MMSPDWFSITQLSSCRSKVERADENIENLGIEINTFLRNNPHRVVGNFDKNSGHYILTAHGQSDMTRFSILAGEIVHHLRSVLDHLAWKLCCKPTIRTCFPIYTADPATDTKVLKRYQRKIEGMGTAAQALIERLQPYHSLGRNHPLAIINKMDVADKHHGLLVVVASVSFPRIRMSNQFMAVKDVALPNPIASEAKDGAEVGRVVPLMGDMNVQVSISFDVAFAQVGLRQNQPIIPTLKQLRDATVTVLNEFSGEFV